MRRAALVVCFLCAFVSAGAAAQWLNYKTPGMPRTRDGKPNLSAPAPRAVDGNPDLSGVWLHELNSVAEIRRLFGPIIDDAVKVDAPGMEIGTQHKYGLNILLDFKPEESPMRPETAAATIGARRAAAEDLATCHGAPRVPAGWPSIRADQDRAGTEADDGPVTSGR